MRFIKANADLRDHALTGEDVHLFEEVPSKRGYLRYKGQMICTGYELVDAPDTERQMRRAIRFELTPLDAFDVPQDGSLASFGASELDMNSEPLLELRRKALADSAETRTP